MPQVSIIIPCYNAASTILQTLASVAKQSFHDYEIIIVDDASEDSTREAVQSFRIQHPSLSIQTICHEKRRGVSIGRNDAMSVAQGKYLTFLDADDTFDPYFLEKMTDAAEKYTADIVACNAVRYRAGQLESTHIYPDRETTVENRESLISNSSLQKFFDTCWAKIYQREFLQKKQIQFLPEMSFAEDTFFANMAALHAEKFVILGKYGGYFYTVGTVSSTSLMQTEKRLKGLTHFLTELSKELRFGEERLLLRKCLEYLWTIKKYGGKERKRLLNEMRESKLWSEMLFPIINKFGKFKHRLILHSLNRNWLWTLRLW